MTKKKNKKITTNRILQGKWTKQVQQDLTEWPVVNKKTLKDKLLDALLPEPDREKLDYPEELMDIIAANIQQEINYEVMKEIEKLGKKKETK